MSKNIMLTLLVIYVILIFVGCKSGDLFIDTTTKDSGDSINKEITELQSSGDVEMVSEKAISSGDASVNNIEEKFVYNESGKIIIVMYHKFAENESDEWTRSYENFYGDLKYLYDHGYRSVSLTSYINNEMKVPVGCTPIVFTFDDGTKGQFNLIKNEEGKLVANPNSAVGVMEKFYEEYPEFGLNGTFFINSSSFFNGEGSNSEKLMYLINEGFEIGNHTSTHVNFSKASKETIQKEVGSVANMVKDLTNGYEINSLALPFGISSSNYKSYIASGEYEGQRYENKVMLLVGSNPVYASNNEKTNLLSLARVRARGGNKAVDFDLYYWLDVMEKNPKLKYERIS